MFSNSLENAFDRLAFDFVLFRFFDGLFVSALVCKATVCRRRPNEIVGNQIREESENGRQWSYGLQVCSDAGAQLDALVTLLVVSSVFCENSAAYDETATRLCFAAGWVTVMPYEG